MKIRSEIKHKKSLFFRIYFRVLIAFLILIGIGLVVLWFALDDYENTIPTNLLKPIISEIKNKDYDRIINSPDFEVSEFESKDDFIDVLNNNVDGAEITYLRHAVAEENVYLYNIKAGEKNIISVTIKKSEKKSKFGFEKYEVDKITASKADDNKIVINAPSNSKVTINGKELTDKYAVEKGIEIEELANVPAEINKPTMTKYEIEGLYKDATIKATGHLGNELNIIKDEKTGEYTVLSNGPQELATTHDALITNVAQGFAKYVTNDFKFSNISKYFLSSSPIYDTIRVMEVYWYTPHDKYEFKNVKTMDFMSYSDDCFSYRITFDHDVYRNNKVASHRECDYTFVFIKSNKNWIVCDMFMQASENN